MSIARLGEHAKFLSGFPFKSEFFNEDGAGLPVVRIRDVVRGVSETFYSGEYDHRYMVSRGDYLIGMDGEFNLARWQSEEALLNQRVCKIDAISEDLDRGYLGRFLHVALKEIEDATPFVTVKHLSVKVLNEIQIPLPPLVEQKRIAAILDAADALRAKRRESLAQLDALVRSVFLDMFGDPVTNPRAWRLSDFDGCITDMTSQSFKIPTTEYCLTGAWQIIDQSQEEVAGYSDKAPPFSTPLPVVIFGDHTRCVKIARTPFLLGADGAKVLAPKDSLRADFLMHLLSLMQLPDLGYSRHMKEVRRLRFPVPPLNKQDSFATVVASVEEQKVAQRAHLAELDTLFASLQSRAFRGDL